MWAVHPELSTPNLVSTTHRLMGRTQHPESGALTSMDMIHYMGHTSSDGVRQTTTEAGDEHA